MLGVPVGTQVYYRLVLRGANADEVWIDATGEDGGNYSPAKPASFLELSLQFFRGKIDELTSETGLKKMLMEGHAGRILEAAKVEDRYELRVQHLSNIQYRGVAESFLSKNEAVKRLMGAFDVSAMQLAGVAYLKAGEWSLAYKIAQEAYALGENEKHIENRFRDVYGLHMLIARIKSGLPVDARLKTPKARTKYRAGHFGFEIIEGILQSLSPEQKQELARWAPVWGNVSE